MWLEKKKRKVEFTGMHLDRVGKVVKVVSGCYWGKWP